MSSEATAGERVLVRSRTGKKEGKFRRRGLREAAKVRIDFFRKIVKISRGIINFCEQITRHCE